MSPRVGSPPADGGYRRFPELAEPRYSQSLGRGLAILESFTPDRPVQGIADIADILRMSRATTHRYVITLTVLGYMEQTANRKYRLGLRVTDLGMSALNSTGLRDKAHSDLDELGKRTAFTTSLAVLDGTDVLYVDRVRSLRRGQNKIDLDVRVGSRLPAYCTALGKVLLAGLQEEQRWEVIGAITLTKRGPHTIRNKKALKAEIEQVANEGLAVNNEEYVSGLVAVAVPVRDEKREVVAAINLAAHTSMIALEDLVDELAPHLVATADHISARLGHRRDDEARR